MSGYRHIALFEPISFTKASCAQKAKVCNGCGSAKAKFDFVPDTIYGLKIKGACDRHDWMYHVGTKLEDKDEADRVFLNNMLRLIETRTNRFMKLLRRRRALKYYEAVVVFGGPAYWKGKN